MRARRPFVALLACGIAAGVACTSTRPADRVWRAKASAHLCCATEGLVTVATTHVQLWYRRLGPPTAPALVFLNGSDAPSSMWDQAFLAPFLAAGLQVILFDARDSGRSEWLPWPGDFDYEDWEPSDEPLYPLEAHVDDLFGLLDALDLERVHLVGLSQGGMIAQLAALAAPDQVASLALLSTSPSNAFDPQLERPAPEFFPDVQRRARRLGRWSLFQRILREPFARELTSFYLAVSGADPAKRADFRTMVDALLDHAPYNARSAQGFAIAAAPSRVGRLPQISAPTLVLHGARDPFFPASHAELLAERIPDARLIVIAGLGHGLPVSGFTSARSEILAKLRRATPK